MLRRTSILVLATISVLGLINISLGARSGGSGPSSVLTPGNASLIVKLGNGNLRPIFDVNLYKNRRFRCCKDNNQGFRRFRRNRSVFLLGQSGVANEDAFQVTAGTKAYQMTCKIMEAPATTQIAWRGNHEIMGWIDLDTNLTETSPGEWCAQTKDVERAIR